MPFYPGSTPLVAAIAEKRRSHEVHLCSAELSRQAHEKAKEFLEAHPPKQELSAILLSRLRKEIKNYLAEEMKEIDKLVGKTIG